MKSIVVFVFENLSFNQLRSLFHSNRRERERERNSSSSIHSSHPISIHLLEYNQASINSNRTLLAYVCVCVCVWVSFQFVGPILDGNQMRKRERERKNRNAHQSILLSHSSTSIRGRKDSFI